MTSTEGRVCAMGASYERAPSADEVAWQLRGLCCDYPPEVFQPITVAQTRVPKKICFDCPVIEQCRTWALTHHEISGVWGGLSETDRESIWAGRRKRARPKRSAAWGMA